MMKKLMVVAVFVLMNMGFSSASIAATDTQATSTQSTTQGMSADHSSQGSQPNDKKENSSSFTESARSYWNKFIDLFTGPPAK